MPPINPEPENILPLDLPEHGHPTLLQCQLLACQLGMPKEEGDKFYYHHDSTDWRIKNQPMKRWRSAMALWKLNWQKWNSPSKEPSGMDKMIWLKELERCEDRIRVIRAGYSENLDVTKKDREELAGLKQRRAELMGKLGMKV